MRAFRLFPAARLPAGFSYPEGLLRLAAGAPHRRLYPWRFIDAEGELALLVSLLASEEGRQLVPFACQAGQRGEIACFDGSDGSGDPAVLMWMAPATGAPAFADFACWMSAAAADAERWQQEQQQKQQRPASAPVRRLEPLRPARLRAPVSCRRRSAR